jgi:hypothetical protein
MKWMLITALLSNPITYQSEDVCKVALAEVSKKDKGAICIPAGETKEDRFVLNFFDLVDKLQTLEQKKVDSSAN